MRNASSAAQSCEVVATLVVALLALADLPGVDVSSGDSPPVPRPWAAPTISDTTPSAGELNVSLSAIIEVRFSEPMNATTLSHAILPFVTLNVTWPQPDILQLSADPGFVACTAYDVEVYVLDEDEGLPLAVGPAPNPWSFMSLCDRPHVLSTVPADEAKNVAIGTDIVVIFSEPMEDMGVGRVRLGLTPTPLSFSTTWSANFTRFTATVDLVAGTTYGASVTGQDRQGNDLVRGLVPNPWQFTVNDPPRVSRPTLSAGGCLDAGSAVAVSWTLSDDVDSPENLTVTLSYKNASGVQIIVGPQQGFSATSTYLWTLPAEDVTTTNVTVEARDSASTVSQNWSAPFRIDSGAPRILTTDPQNGSLDVPFEGTITIVFSEPMNHSSVESAFAVSPTLPGAQYAWLSNGTLQVDPGFFIDRQRYTVTLDGAARDTCGVGKDIGQDLTFSFTTGKAPPAPPGLLAATGRGETSITLAWDRVVLFVTGRVIPSELPIVYLVYRAEEGQGLGDIVALTNNNWTVDGGLRPETTYTYRVLAVVDGVPSGPSASLRVTTITPFFRTWEGGFVLIVLAASTVALVAAWGQSRRRRERARAEAQLEADVEEVVELVQKARTEADPAKRRTYENDLQARFLALVQGPEDRGEIDPRLDGLYRALARSLVRSPEVDVLKGRQLVDARLGDLSKALASQGASYRILSEAEASHLSDLFRELPESAKKALMLVYFYSLEEYLSHRLRALVPRGATVLLGERGHINVRVRGWEQQWAGLTLGNLLYLLDHNRQYFLADEDRWEDEVAPFVHQTVDARNRTAHPSREAPPLDRVRELIYTSFRLFESVLKAPRRAAS